MHCSTPCTFMFTQSEVVLPAQGSNISGGCTPAVLRSWSHSDVGVSRSSREEGWLETAASFSNKARNSLETGAAQAAGLNYILRMVPGWCCFPLNPVQAWLAGNLVWTTPCYRQASTDAQMPVAGPQPRAGTSTSTGPSSISITHWRITRLASTLS